MSSESLAQATKSDRIWWWLVPLIVAGAAAGAGNLFHNYYLLVLSSWVISGILALSLAFVWGQAGVMSFGHTAFYGIGAYLYGVLAINYESLTGGNTLIWAVAAGIVGGGLAAAALGYFLFYGELGDVQTTVVTVAFTLIMLTLAVGLQFRVGNAFVGGDNGMIGIPPLTIGWGSSLKYLMPLEMFRVVVAIAVIVYLLVKAVMRQPFGLIINAVRINQTRASLLGYDVRQYRLLAFTMSGAIAGLAGALYASWANFVNPSMFGLQDAARVVTWVLVGGHGSLAGGFVGALSVEAFTFWLSGGAGAGQTTLVLGLALILGVLFLPGGMVGVARSLWNKVHRWVDRRSRSRTPEAGGTGSDEAPGIDVEAVGELRKLAVPSTVTSGVPAADEQFLVAERVCKRFGGLVAVRDVSLQFRRNEVYCMIGPNGAGKSTLFNLLVGRYRPDEGRIVFCGNDITRWAVHRRVREGIGIKLQVATVFDELTVYENMWLAAYGRRRDAAAAHRVTADTLRLLGLAHKAHVPANHLAHGEQQWLDIGMVLALDTDVIFLDEPTAGMTPQETKRAIDLIRYLAQKAMVMVVEHDMEFVRELGAPVQVLHQGALFASGSIQELRRDTRVLDIYLGRAT